jgi:hypothetical protein
LDSICNDASELADLQKVESGLDCVNVLAGYGGIRARSIHEEDPMKLFPRRAWFCRVVAGQYIRLFRLGGMVCVGLMMLLAMPVRAAVHPVPLDKNTDAKKCLECHDDKAKHKFVHSAM